MQGTRHRIAPILSLAVIILSLTSGAIADAHTTYRSSVAVNGTTVATPSPIAIFGVGGFSVVMRARGEYLDEQRRKAAMLREDET